jgi:putative lipoic acid-binding regulatory protein
MMDFLEELLEFPCSFPVKAVGKGIDDFEDLVVSILQRHVPDLGEDCVTSRPSKQGTYLAVTVTFMAESRVQLEAIYRELSDHERVLMVF